MLPKTHPSPPHVALSLTLAALGVVLSLTAHGQSSVERRAEPVAFHGARTPPPPITKYAIDVSLDPGTRTLDGTMTLTYYNRTADTIPTLQFHMYMNAFKNQDASMWKEAGSSYMAKSELHKRFGYVELDTLTIDGVDLHDATRYIAPDDGNEADQTVLEVALPSPILPGGECRIETKFTVKIPKVHSRSGYVDGAASFKDNFLCNLGPVHNTFGGEYFLMAHWFPKLGVWETAGHRGRVEPGWNCHQHHDVGEFYANFGAYDVSITVPHHYTVGATGKRVETNESEAGRTLRYFQHDVIDFAWTASPEYKVVERMFIPEEWVTPEELEETADRYGLTVDQVALKPVEVRLFVQPEESHQAHRYFDATFHAIKYFGLWFGPYPYETLTLVNPPVQGRGSNGMEYPTFITGGGYRRAPEGTIGGNSFFTNGPEHVAIHEFGHQYWQGMVATNEMEEAFLDEAMTEYCTWRVIDRAYGGSEIYSKTNDIHLPIGTWFGVKPINSLDQARFGAISLKNDDAIARNAWEFLEGSNYYGYTYLKGTAILQTLERELGEDTMLRALRAYFSRWQYGHPALEDLVDSVNEVSGRDMTWFFDETLRKPDFVDYAVETVRSRAVKPGKGYYDREDGPELITDPESPPEDEVVYDCTVVVRNHGGIHYPTTIQITFEDDTVLTEPWDGAYRYKKLQFQRDSKIARVVVDPERILVIDTNWANNSRDLDAEPETLRRWGGLFLTGFQHLLQTFGGLI